MELSENLRLVTSYSCNKVSAIDTQERKIYFGSQFHRFQPTVNWIENKGRIIMAMALCLEAYFTAARKQKDGKGQQQDRAPKDTSQSPTFSI